MSKHDDYMAQALVELIQNIEKVKNEIAIIQRHIKDEDSEKLMMYSIELEGILLSLKKLTEVLEIFKS